MLPETYIYNCMLPETCINSLRHREYMYDYTMFFLKKNILLNFTVREHQSDNQENTDMM